MGIVGIATVPRHAHQPALIQPADAIDAELIEPADESGPESRPDSPEGEMRYPEAGEVADGDMPPGSDGLMTLEDAADAERTAARLHRNRRRS